LRRPAPVRSPSPGSTLARRHSARPLRRGRRASTSARSGSWSPGPCSATRSPQAHRCARSGAAFSPHADWSARREAPTSIPQQPGQLPSSPAAVCAEPSKRRSSSSPAGRLLRALRRATPHATLPERVNAEDGNPTSTTPLAWSHAFAILALRTRYPAGERGGS
jgi:hypothetical protein